MTTRPRMKVIAACVGVALAQLSATSARADSATGVDTALGNALNPPGRTAIPRPIAADAYDTVRRSPSGQLYGVPVDQSGETTKTADGWEYKGGVEVGVLGGEGKTKNSIFRKYKDMRNGAYVDYFELEADKASSAEYMQAFGGGVGYHDQFYGVQYGHYNEWRLRLYFNETRHVYTDNWKTLFRGDGTGNLTTGLPVPTAITTGAYTQGTSANFIGPTTTCTATAPCWGFNGTVYSNAIGGAAGSAAANTAIMAAVNGTTGTPNRATGVIPVSAGVGATGATQSGIAKAIADQLAGTDQNELAVTRKKGGVRLDATLDNFWKGYVNYTQEKRTGARPFAMNEGNFNAEVGEPIDYTTHELLAGVSYVDGPTQANIRTSVSMFRNSISTLNVQYPLLNSAQPFGVVQTATYQLNPDNTAFNLKGEFARDLPEFFKGRFTAAASWGTSRQDESLLPPISPAQNAQLAAAGITRFGGTSTNVGYGVGTALVSNWNTVAALSQATANQRIDNKLLDLGFAFKPIDDLNMKAGYRSYQFDNKGGYMAYNPLTGQFGRGFADGNNINMDVIVGLAPGMLPTGAAPTAAGAGNCYIPSGFPAVPACTFVGTNTALAGANNGSNIPVFGQARSTKQTNYTLTADYDLSRTASINGAIEREEFKRNFRERDKTWENKFKLGYVNRALENATLRLSGEHDRKRGGEYRFRTFEDLGTGLPGLYPEVQVAQAGVLGANGVAAYMPFSPLNGAVANNANLFNRYSYYFRKYDQADRNQTILNGRLNYLVSGDMDVGFMFQTRKSTFPNSIFGLTKDDLNSGTVEFNYQPVTGESLYGFYSIQQGKKGMNMNSGVALNPVNNTCTAATIATYGYSACSDNINGIGGTRPASDNWSADQDDRNNVFGVGFQKDLGKASFGLDYTFTESKTRIQYEYGATALNGTAANQAAIAAIAGSTLPNMTYLQHTLTMNLLFPIDKRMSIRLFDRYELARVKDWHYDGILTNAVSAYDNGTLLLDGGPQGYRANVIGVFLQYKL